jgi:hypothetical protein
MPHVILALDVGALVARADRRLQRDRRIMCAGGSGWPAMMWPAGAMLAREIVRRLVLMALRQLLGKMEDALTNHEGQQQCQRGVSWEGRVSP